MTDHVSVTEIEAAWLTASIRIERAIDTVLHARYALLEAGIGDDHPECEQLDEYAGTLRRAHERLRARATSRRADALSTQETPRVHSELPVAAGPSTCTECGEPWPCENAKRAAR